MAESHGVEHYDFRFTNYECWFRSDSLLLLVLRSRSLAVEWGALS